MNVYQDRKYINKAARRTAHPTSPQKHLFKPRKTATAKPQTPTLAIAPAFS